MSEPAMSDDLTRLPENLPVPEDDGAADHLAGLQMPAIGLPATDGGRINLRELPGCCVVYIYPMTGRPDVALPEGWNAIPGARGCTPQACNFRDHFQELQSLGAGVYGLSTQTTEYQREVRDRLHLPFELLSDCDLSLNKFLKLPIFTLAGTGFYRRLTLVLIEARILKVFYPIPRPDKHADEVVRWLQRN